MRTGNKTVFVVLLALLLVVGIFLLSGIDGFNVYKMSTAFSSLTQELARLNRETKEADQETKPASP